MLSTILLISVFMDIFRCVAIFFLLIPEDTLEPHHAALLISWEERNQWREEKWN